jgi:predicted glycogen debranching enzyme
MMCLAESICGDLTEAARREWLETNGLGGFASSTIVGLNTRRYHGLLVAALHPPVRRFVLLSKLEETLIVDGRRYELSTNRYPGVVYPEGYRRQIEFRLDPYPIFTYAIEDVIVEKHVFLVYGTQAVVVQYSLSAPADREARLDVRPLVAFRDYHTLTHENAALDRSVAERAGAVVVRPYQDLPALTLAHDAARVQGCLTEMGESLAERPAQR